METHELPGRLPVWRNKLCGPCFLLCCACFFPIFSVTLCCFMGYSEIASWCVFPPYWRPWGDFVDRRFLERGFGINQIYFFFSMNLRNLHNTQEAKEWWAFLYEIRNETKRNETQQKRNKIKQKRNETNRNETQQKRNEKKIIINE
jgi:hypothetical protein